MPKKPISADNSSKDKTDNNPAENTEIETGDSASKLLPGLMHGLQAVFDKIHKDNRERGLSQEKIIEEFTTSLNHAFEQAHAEAKEREKLLDEKLETIEKEQSYKIQRIKLFSLPGALIAAAALIYLFYVVHIMERSMTSMSSDMGYMRGYIATISLDTRTMSDGVVFMNNQMTEMNVNMSQIDQQMAAMNGSMKNIDTQVSGMNGNMHHLNRSVGVMTHDVGNMSQTVSPMMSGISGMRRFMPF